MWQIFSPSSTGPLFSVGWVLVATVGASFSPVAYDEQLAERVRLELGDRPELSERKMFGGIGFMLKGNMSCGVRGEELIVRVDPEESDEALEDPQVRLFDISGRRMKGWLLVRIESDEQLRAWVDRAAAFASSLPAKS
jgi:TfoX/Sxy family transcriptional regulator of competence genes